MIPGLNHLAHIMWCNMLCCIENHHILCFVSGYVYNMWQTCCMPCSIDGHVMLFKHSYILCNLTVWLYNLTVAMPRANNSAWYIATASVLYRLLYIIEHPHWDLIEHLLCTSCVCGAQIIYPVQLIIWHVTWHGQACILMLCYFHTAIWNAMCLFCAILCSITLQYS